jgi:phenol 2-monooxygenase (NADPH)
MFCPDFGGRGDIFDMRAIDRAKGCIVVVRPDQYVAEILPLDDRKALTAWFAGFMRPASAPDPRRRPGRS